MAARQDRRRKGATSCFFARPFPDTYDRSQVLFGRSQPPRTEGDGNEGERESHLREPQVTRRVWRPPPWPAARPCLATAHREDGGREREPEHGHARCRRRALGGRPMTQKRGFASFGKKRTEDARTKGGGNPETPSDALWTTRPKRSFLARPLRCMLGHRFLTSLPVPLPRAARLAGAARRHARLLAPARVLLQVPQPEALPDLLLRVPASLVARPPSEFVHVVDLSVLVPVRPDVLPVPPLGGMVGTPRGHAVLLSPARGGRPPRGGIPRPFGTAR